MMIYRLAAHGRCRFLRRNGTFTRPRSCSRPIEYLGSGTSHWRLHLRIRIPPGRYLVRSDAVDGYGRHQRHTAASVKRVVAAAAARDAAFIGWAAAQTGAVRFKPCTLSPAED